MTFLPTMLPSCLPYNQTLPPSSIYPATPTHPTVATLFVRSPLHPTSALSPPSHQYPIQCGPRLSLGPIFHHKQCLQAMACSCCCTLPTVTGRSRICPGFCLAFCSQPCHLHLTLSLAQATTLHPSCPLPRKLPGMVQDIHCCPLGNPGHLPLQSVKSQHQGHLSPSLP